MERLGKRNQKVLDWLRGWWDEFGVPASINEASQVTGMARQTLREAFKDLTRLGFLEQVETTNRVVWRLKSNRPAHPGRLVPVLGEVAAGFDIFAQENIVDWLPARYDPSEERLYALRVRGDSMMGIGVFEGDVVIVRHQETAQDGDLVVALVDGRDAALKYWLSAGENKVKLVSMNIHHDHLECSMERVQIRGKVTELRRWFE